MMKSNTLRKRPTDVPVQKASEQPGKDLRCLLYTSPSP
ncbi:hypothetical protein OQ618_25900, partial [Escherichia coli]|nr:hypothetical protein [Escherichia coli]